MGILESMLALEQEAASAQSEWMSPTEAELARLLSLLLSTPERERTRLTEAGLLRYLASHISEPLHLARAANHFGVSRDHLSRRARELLGAPLGEVAAARRLEHARMLLASSAELHVADVARRVGYTDPFYFSRVFKKRFGLSPRHYLSTREPAAPIDGREESCGSPRSTTQPNIVHVNARSVHSRRRADTVKSRSRSGASEKIGRSNKGDWQ